ncbi:glycosyltransferase family 4 protein [Phytohabitans rumicis]|uniref:Glycosyl hydrolase n=1 Tax=Phytohabitans rumicis TaxID=1076125 RepID=A0A6V8L5W7_9ACTN|nr:glycosyltransferase family 4 protein [Phytohabitans rumicis]GFJ92642.1 glycosyl hydrolase [Phytohabitans rumicis]
MASVLVVSWRDTQHPEGGGSERYVERIAEGLVARGHQVTIRCPRHDNAPDREQVDGVDFIRRGNKYTVHLYAMLAVLFSRADVVIDVQNGLPFFSRLFTRATVVVVLHHLHRQQWYSWFGRRLGGVGWWIESRLAPVVYRRCRYVTVSEHTRSELATLGVTPERVSVVPNGLDPVTVQTSRRAPEPLLVAVSRLMPHKRLEHAIDAVALLRDRWPGLRLEIVGRGPWLETLREHAAERGVADHVLLHGWVDEQDKHEILARSWVHLCPSAKEGWGIVVMEAAARGVPTVAYRSAGGVCESVLDGRTGLLADDFGDFVAGVERLLSEADLRARMDEAGRAHASNYEWKRSVDAFEEIILGEQAQLQR